MSNVERMLDQRLSTPCHFLKAVVGTAAAMLVGYFSLFGWFVCISPLTYAELDLNRDGHVGFSEAEYAASFGERMVEEKDQKCTEYFAYKDGLPLKVVCPSQG